MTNNEKIAAIKTGRIIRAGRKSHGWTQIEVAKTLGITQGALSKMEAGKLIPSVQQWFEFCRSGSIPFDSLFFGYLDRLQPVTLQESISNQNFKINEIYTEYAGSTARSLFPLIGWAEQKLGPEKINSLWKALGVDPDYFVDLSNPINFRFFADFTALLKSEGLFKKSDFQKITRPLSDGKNHGLLNQTYQQDLSVEPLFKTVFSNSSMYEVNFNYVLEEASQNKVVFSATPNSHLLSERQLGFYECQDFLPAYRTCYFENILSLLPHKTVLQTREFSSRAKGEHRFIHEIHFR